MPRTPAQPLPKNASPGLLDAMRMIDRAFDPWYLPNWRVSVLGDAKLYATVEHLRENALRHLGIAQREHGAVRDVLRGRLICERSNPVAFRYLAAMLIGERRLAGVQGLAETKAMARRFAPRAA